MKLIKYLLVTSFFLISGAALAECPKNSPNAKWNTHSEDQRVDAAYLQKLLPGKKVKFGKAGTEVYNSDGSYTYRTSNKSYDAPNYKFYNDGVRCINYSNPRFDLYVINGKRLFLINGKGGRLKGELTN